MARALRCLDTDPEVTVPKLIPFLLLLAACSTTPEHEPAPAVAVAPVVPVTPTPPASPSTPEPRPVPSLATNAATAPVPAAAEGVATTEGLRARRAVISSGMVGREPTDSLTETFPAENTRLYAFIELDNPERVNTKIVSYWLRPDGTKHSPVELTVGPQRSWRTWAYTTNARTLGTWTAVFESSSGEPIARRSIELR